METLHCINLPSHGPVISFDVRLGKKIPQDTVLDFSKRQFRVLCESVVPSVPDAADYARIHIAPGRANGSYREDTGVIEVEYAGNESATNATLRHETRHYLEQVEGRFPHQKYYEWTKHMRRIGYWALWTGIPVTVIATDAYLITRTGSEPTPAYLDEVMKVTAGISVGGLFMALSHWLHPSEVRASYTTIRHSHIRPLALVPKSHYWHSGAKV